MSLYVKFSRFGTTINSKEIVNSIHQHGTPVFQTSEMHLKPFVCRKSVCNQADIIAVFRSSDRHYIVGIEIKEWKEKVHPKLAVEYLDTYGRTCEYFYLAAKHFSKQILEMEGPGLFDLEQMEVIKSPAYLFPETDFRAHLMKRIKKQFNVLLEVVDDPYQRTLLEF